MTNLHPASQLLIKTTKQYPNLTKQVNNIRQLKGAELPDWHNYCFIPMAGWHHIVSTQKYNGQPIVTLEGMQDLQLLAALGTWRYTQGIYSFDDDMFKAVTESDITGNLPSDLLLRLPEWCIYIETPNLKLLERDCQGVFVYLEHEMGESGHTELRIFTTFDEILEDGIKQVGFPIHLGDWTLEYAISEALKINLQAGLNLGIVENVPIINEDYIPIINEDYIKYMCGQLMPIISLILFICSEQPDISALEEPDEQPSNPQAKKTKKGLCLFPKDKPRQWQVGKRYGEILRQEIKQWQTDTGRTVKPHVRCGHYHTYWVGKRNSDERRAILKFVMPTIVGAKE